MGCTREITGVELAETAMTLRAKRENLSSLKTTSARTEALKKVLEDFIVKKEGGEDVYLRNAGIDEECIKRLMAYSGRDALRWHINWMVGRTDIYNVETPMVGLDSRKVDALGEIKDYIVIKPLLTILTDPVPSLPTHAGLALSNVFGNAIVGVGVEKGAIISELVKALNSDEVKVRNGALKLFSTPMPSSIKPLSKPMIAVIIWEAYKYGNPEVISEVKKARNNMPGDQVEKLMEGLRDNNPFVAIAALERLVELGIEPLLKAKRDSLYRYGTCLNLDEAIPEVISKKPPTPKLIDSLVDLLNSKNVFVQSDAKDLLIAIIVSPNTEIAQKKQLASRLVSLLKTDVDVVIELDAQKLLIKIGAPAVDELIKKLGDDSFDSIYVEETLVEIGPPAVDSLIIALRDKKITYEARRTLAEIGKKDKGTIEKLRDAALKQFNDIDTFRNTISVLGDIGGADAKKALIEMGKKAQSEGKTEVSIYIDLEIH